MTIVTLLSRRTALVLLATSPASCAMIYWTDPVLTPIVGPIKTGSPRTVAILPIHLPQQYLIRTEIVGTWDGSQPVILQLDLRAQSPWDLIGQVTVQNLIQRLPGGIVYADTGVVTQQPAASVDITIVRFDVNQTGSLQLQAQLAVSGWTTQSRNVLYSVTPADSSAASRVYAMSLALGQMSDLIVTLLLEKGPRAGSFG